MEERIYNPQFFEKDFLKGKSGIYQIRNLVNNKIYIGGTKDLERRCRFHFNALNRGNHENKYLQRAYNKQGKDSFIFEVIEFCEPKIRFEIEQYWINKYIGNIICYNLNEKASCPPVRTKEDGNSPTFTKEQREHLSRVKKKYYEDHPEMRELQSKRRKGKRVGKDNPCSKEVICLETGKIYASMREAGNSMGIRGKDISSCCNGKQLTVKGYHWLCKEEYDRLTREEIQIIMNKTYTPHHKQVKCLETNKIYYSIKEAAEELNITSGCITQVCRGQLKSIHGYHFEYVN